MVNIVNARLVILAFAAVVATDPARADSTCGSLLNAVGPWDYRTATQERRELVERFHFKPETEALKGQGVIGLAADLQYTLRAFPNHPRALVTIGDLARKQKRAQPPGFIYPIECWFERAIRFQPDDGQVRLVYGVALLKDGNRDGAIEQLQKADQLLPRNANVHYNLGLAYFDTKNYAKAREHAKIAYELGFPLPGLKDKLQRASQWQ